jgi:hypothetical protein
MGLFNTGLYSKMININCFVPDNLTAAITPLIATAGSGSSEVSNTWTNIGFVDSDLSVSGLKGDGTSYLKTGAKMTDAPTDNVGMTLYNSFPDASNKNDFGVIDATSQGTQFLLNYQGTTYFDCYNGGASRAQGTPLTNGLGYGGGNRISATSSSIFKASSTVPHAVAATSTGASGTPQIHRDLWVFCLNNQGSPFGQTSKCFSFVGFHQGLTVAQSSEFFNLIQTMRVGLGGGYV